MTYYSISALINILAGLLLGIFALYKNPRAKINRSLFFWCFTVVFWSTFYFIWQLEDQESKALLWTKLLMLGAVWVPVAYLRVVLIFLNIEKRYKYFLYFNYVLSVLFSALLLTPLMVTKVEPILGFPFWPKPGLAYIPFLAMFLGISAYSAYLSYKALRTEQSSIKRSQIKYMLFGIAISIIAGSTNYFLWYDIPIKPYGNLFASTYVVFTVYAIVTKKLFDIKVALTSLFVGLIAVLLLIDTLAFSEKLSFQIAKGGILIVFLFFAYLLIRSVLREIKYREEAKEAYEVEKKAREGLKRLDEAKNQFIMATQHHLRTPLTSMQGYLDLIFGGTYGKVSPKIKETLRKFQVSTNRLIKVVNEFLDISQFQLGKSVVSLQPNISIKPIFEEIIEELQLEAKARGIYLKLQKQERIPKIKADPEKLKMALYNIIDNGIKYTNKGGVKIKLETKGSRLRIIVKDTGTGISKEDQKVLFTRLFERGKEAKKLHGTGRGIGLYIAFHIIKAHKGKIWAESKGRGKGSTFHIELPIK